MEKYGEVVRYDKLVRDKIPEIIEGKGKSCIVRVAEQQEYLKKLKEKLQEELDEFLESESEEELADMLEVMYSIAEEKGFSKEAIEEIRVKKFNERGGFSQKIILEEA
jgi:predicted house-cleaning noncanonical NTP pyrophosphatase (MazG superfamily)